MAPELELLRRSAAGGRLASARTGGVVLHLRGRGGRWTHRGVRLWGLGRPASPHWLEVDGVPVARVRLVNPKHKHGARHRGFDRWTCRFQHGAPERGGSLRIDDAALQSVLAGRQLRDEVLQREELGDVLQPDLQGRRTLKQRDGLCPLGDGGSIPVRVPSCVETTTLLPMVGHFGPHQIDQY